MKTKLIKLYSSLFYVALFVFGTLNAALIQNVLTSEQWREDLNYLSRELPKRHPDLFHITSHEEFDQAVNDLYQNIPSLKDHEIIIGFAGIVAMTRDGHSRLTLPQDPTIAFTQAHSNTPFPSDSSLILSQFPIRLYSYDDGLFVQESTPDYIQTLGARLIKIGDTSADDALEAVRKIIHYDNEMGFKLIAPTRLVIPEVLHALKLTNDAESAQFTFEGKDRKPFTINLKAIARFTDVEWIDVRDDAKTPSPLWLKDRSNYYWFEYLKNFKTVYVQFNRVNNKEEETIAEFCDKVFGFVDDHSVERFVLDLRWNFGGNNDLNLSMLHGLIKSDKVNQPGRFFTLVGRGTFSAAMMLAVDLEKHTETLFVGEPTGSTPNNFGDSLKMKLPNSGLTVRVSTLYWQYSDPRDTRTWIAPHVSVVVTSDDFRSNRDPVLEAVLNYIPQRPLTEKMIESMEREGLIAAVALYREFKDDPRNAFANTEMLLNDLAYRLLFDEKYQEAITIFKLNVEDYPKSFNVYDSLGEAYMLFGDKKHAIRNYKKSLELNSANHNAVEILRKLGLKL